MIHKKHPTNAAAPNQHSPFGQKKGTNNNNGIFDKKPEHIPFPFGFQFSRPAKYHTKGQIYKVGDLVWYEVKGTFKNSRDHIQWGEAIVIGIVDLEKNIYQLAGKTWNYDHYTHPLIGRGIPGGPFQFSNVTSTEESRIIYRNWAQVNHPNLHVRRNALLGVDEVMHSALMSVPGDAMFKVWDRESSPQNPIMTHSSSSNNIDDENDTLFKPRDEDFSLHAAREIYGSDLQFKGMKQNNLGPEMWGLTLEQLLAVQDLEGYDEEMLMYDVVEKLIKPQTKGKGIGYGLLLNMDKPLRAKYMVSHAWGESYDHFVRAMKDSKFEGPFWVCAMSIYQNEDIPSISISKQLGPSLENGPFATVLKQATQMIVVFTPAVDVYTRMWCVFEIFVAVKNDVPVKFVALSYQFLSGMENIYDAIFEHGKKESITTEARCGDPSKPINNDEKNIRTLIKAYPGTFHILNSVIEWCKAMYHIGETTHPGLGFRSDPEHCLFLGGPSRYDFLAKNISSVALALDRLDAAVQEVENEKKTGSARQGLCNACCIT